jgi:uncharacterized protein YkwD
MKRLFIGALALLIAFSVKAQSSLHISNRLFRDQFLESINSVRARGCNCGTTYMPPAPPLTWNEVLTQAAMGHATDMSYQNYFSHQSLDGRTLRERVMSAGYTYTGYSSFAIGENIAKGQQTIQEVSTGWFESPGHCKNLMNPSFKEIGIAEINHYWVQDFGGRTPFTEDQKKILRNGGRLIMRNVK